MLLFVLGLTIKASSSTSYQQKVNLQKVNQPTRVPALALIVVSPKTTQTTLIGRHKVGDRRHLRVSDQVPLGSLAAPILSTLVAKLIDLGRLQWRTNLHELVEWKKNYRSEYRGATIEQVLLHRAGLSNREGLSVEQGLTIQPESLPGEAQVYSSIGLKLVQTIIERLEGVSIGKVFLNVFGLEKTSCLQRRAGPLGHKERGDNFSPLETWSQKETVLSQMHCSFSDLTKILRFLLEVRSGTPLKGPQRSKLDFKYPSDVFRLDGFGVFSGREEVSFQGDGFSYVTRLTKNRLIHVVGSSDGRKGGLAVRRAANYGATAETAQ